MRTKIGIMRLKNTCFPSKTDKFIKTYIIMIPALLTFYKR